MIRKKLFLSVLVVAVLSLTSCIDIIQSVTISKGTVYSDLSITLQKSALEMASSMSGEEADYSDFFDDDLLEDFTNEHVDATLEEINNETEVGYFISMNFKKNLVVDPKDCDELYFVPIIDKKTISILFNYNEKDKDKEENGEEAQMEQMTNAVLGGCKYRLLLRADEFEVKQVELIGIKAGTVEVKKYGRIYIVEMPLSVWLTAKEDFTLKVHYK